MTNDRQQLEKCLLPGEALWQLGKNGAFMVHLPGGVPLYFKQWTPTALPAEGVNLVASRAARSKGATKTEVIKSPHIPDGLLICGHRQKTPGGPEKIESLCVCGTCTFSARLNVFLNLHTVQVAAGGNLPDLRYVNIISAHIAGWLAGKLGREAGEGGLPSRGHWPHSTGERDCPVRDQAG